MTYYLGGMEYPTKKAITEHCQSILHKCQFGDCVDEDDFCFLADVFSNHTEWKQKTSSGFDGVSVSYSAFYRTRYFTIMCKGEEVSDISYPHAIKHLPSTGIRQKQPQALLDFRNAARAAIRGQINLFRATAPAICAMTGMDLSDTRKLMHIDHKPPATFDRLVFDFCNSAQINPLLVLVKEIETVPTFLDARLAEQWSLYHRNHAKLRVLSRSANLGLQKINIPWNTLFSAYRENTAYAA